MECRPHRTEPQGGLSAGASGAFLCNCAIFAVSIRDSLEMMCIFSYSGHSQVNFFQVVIWPNDQLAWRCAKRAAKNCTCAICWKLVQLVQMEEVRLRLGEKMVIIAQLHTHTGASTKTTFVQGSLGKNPKKHKLHNGTKLLRLSLNF